MQRYLEKNHTTFSLPQLNLYEENQPSWNAHALQGEALLGNEEIHLSGGVELHQSKGPHNTTTNIQTASVVIYPELRVIKTADAIVAIQPNAQVTSLGMQLDLTHKVLNLLSQVQGIYKPVQKKPINIVSDKASLMKEVGISVFEGKVKLTQGTSILLTPYLTLYTDKNNELIKAVATGAGTTYRNLADPKKPSFIARAQEIQYLPVVQQIYLKGEAKASQGKNSYSAPEISYHIDQESVMSQGGKNMNIITPTNITANINNNINILTVKALQKSYASRQVVREVSFHVNSGEIVGLLGPNGAGKTTSFYMVVGLVQSDQGQVFFNQTEITYMPMHERARLGIGYLPQEPSVFRKLTVADNILAILELRPDLSEQARSEKLEKLLNEFHITHLRETYGISLSGGERRRVEIARALAIEPKFILLDEPFAGIDPISVIELKRIIHQLNRKNIGILITDHNVRETLTTCHRAYIVNEGTILCEGSPDIILADKQVREVYLGDDFAL
ncbi:unnamed protein product [Adineta steineri]|uniref:Lipopolysaccharide export system ATP-binding protein LptB n=1 Tax=Adineta steineri TaxID=433720 RepID=A0A815QJI1_9BILA|nr:unnamed protein product [Adineta steineri]